MGTTSAVLLEIGRHPPPAFSLSTSMDFHDCYLSAFGTLFPAHRVFLARSSFFKGLFSTQMTGAVQRHETDQLPVYSLQLEGIGSKESLELWLKHVYVSSLPDGKACEICKSAFGPIVVELVAVCGFFGDEKSLEHAFAHILKKHPVDVRMVVDFFEMLPQISEDALDTYKYDIFTKILHFAAGNDLGELLSNYSTSRLVGIVKRIIIDDVDDANKSAVQGLTSSAVREGPVIEGEGTVNTSFVKYNTVPSAFLFKCELKWGHRLKWFGICNKLELSIDAHHKQRAGYCSFKMTAVGTGRDDRFSLRQLENSLLVVSIRKSGVFYNEYIHWDGCNTDIGTPLSDCVNVRRGKLDTTSFQWELKEPEEEGENICLRLIWFFDAFSLGIGCGRKRRASEEEEEAAGEKKQKV